MRITETMNLNSVLESESRVSERMAQLTQMASSGLRVSQPSDDPVAYASLVQRDAGIATVQARQSATTTAAGDLDQAGNILNQATAFLQQVRALAVEESNGTRDAASRANTASVVDSLRQQLIGLANAKGSSGYLFGGTKSDSPPVDPSGNFVGNSGVSHVEVADGVLAASNADGAQAFSPAGGRDIFADLQALSTALTSNDTAGIQASIANIDASHAQIVAAQTDTGERAARLHSASDAMSAAVTQMQVARAPVADADAATTISNLEAAQTAYQAALQVNKQILSLSLAQAGG